MLDVQVPRLCEWLRKVNVLTSDCFRRTSPRPKRREELL